MTFRKSAALGLSALMLSGNMLLPLAEATPGMVGGQANQRLSGMVNSPLYSAMAQQPVLHPVQKKTTQAPNVLDWLNPLNLFNFDQQTSKKTTAAAPVVKVAMPLPIPKEPAKMQPVKKLTVTKKHTTKQQAKTATSEVKPVIQAVKPLEPTVSINLPIRDKTVASAAPITKQAPRIEPTDIIAATKTFTYTQIFLPKAPAPVNQTSTSAVAKTNPTFSKIYQTRDPEALRIAEAKAEKAAEAFSMMSTTALDKLVMETKSTNLLYGQGMDTSTPGTYNGTNNVKILKSGISQKMASVDLTIGKAEVMYLSRPASRVSVSNPEVATAVVISPTQIQLIGKAVGVANLLVWGDMVSPDHTVVDINVHKDVSVLVSQLKYVDPGIQIVPMAAEDTVILTGQAENRETAQLALEMAKAFFSHNNNMAGVANNNGPNSQAPGSALPGIHTNVINLIKIKGQPSTKIELVRHRLNEVDPNIQIEVVPGPDGNEKVILTGRVPTASIASKALNLASVFYGQPGLKMITAQGGNDFTRLSISSESSSSGSSTQTSAQSGTQAGGANMLQGSIMTDATGNVISMLEIAQKPQIRCSIKFLELTKTSLNALGGTINGMSGNTGIASWSGVQSAAPGKAISALSTEDMSGAAFSSLASRVSGSNNISSRFNEVYQGGITQVLTINNQLAAAIQALQEKKQVRTLAEPTLTLLSGEQGSFLAGGEIPIAFVGGQGQVSIEYKEFGIRLNLLPTVTDDGKIQMQVAPEVSSLDQANGVSTNSVNVPAFISRRMNTTLLVEPGQSFVLAGLYNQQDTDSMSRFPGLGSIPILGSFFRNTWDSRTKSEMVVVIRPEIIYSNTGVSDAQTSVAPTSPKTTELSKK